MLYFLHEMGRIASQPMRAALHSSRLLLDHPGNFWGKTQTGRSLSASLALFERVTRRYGKPEFGITSVRMGRRSVPVESEIVWSKPFCRLLHFKKLTEDPTTASDGCSRSQPRVLIVAPLSGHYATLLRGTVETLLPHADVYITDWADARSVPLSEGAFDLDDYIDYLIEMLAWLGGGVTVMAVCQPSVPVLAAVSLMSQQGHPALPAAMVLMGGPIDTRCNPTVVNKLAMERGVDWFRRNVIVKVPFPNAGFMRRVYPGFLQLTGFMTMNLDRHLSAHHALFWHLVEGDGDSAQKHDEFYDEYMSVMDLTAEFYLQTVEQVFVNHALPRGIFRHRGQLIDPRAITQTALMTVEGEKDDISGLGQTRATHDLCTGIPSKRRRHYMQPGVGHYGVFNGRRFRRDIAPRIVSFIGEVVGKELRRCLFQ